MIECKQAIPNKWNKYTLSLWIEDWIDIPEQRRDMKQKYFWQRYCCKAIDADIVMNRLDEACD